MHRYAVAAIVTTALVAASGGPSAGALRQAQFRSGTDIIAIDFLAARRDGQPITDLTAKEITVKVDGRVREIKSFQFVTLSTASRVRAAVNPPLPAPFAANDGPIPGRTVIIVVDHEQIRAAESKNAMNAAGRFLGRLTPLDRVAVVTMPNGKVETDLTTNHARVHEALSRVIGRQQRKTGISNISVDEAMTVLAEKADPDKQFTKELVDRECKFAPGDSYCRTRVVTDALQYVREIELATQSSLVALRDFLNGLASVEGPKAILYLSGSLVAFPDTHIELAEVARAAARARAQMFIVQPHDTIANSEVRDSPPSTTLDMKHRVSGLEDLAGVTGGEFFRMSGLGDLVFGRIADQISSHYLLGFEPRSGENNGKPHKIEITTTRRNVLIRARPMFILDDDKRAPPPPMVLETLLRDFATYRDLPIRAAAYAVRSPDPAFVKIVVVTELTEPATTLKSAAFALINVEGRAAAEWTEEGANVVSRPLMTSAAVPPGDYRLRVVAMDTGGRRGAVDYEFAARLTDAAPLQIGALMTGLTDKGNFRPRLSFEAGDEEIAGYVEFYGNLAAGSVLTATFEISDSPDGLALVSRPAQVQGALQASRFLASGSLPLASIGPGNHLIRTILFVNGRPVGQVIRTFQKHP